MVCTGMPDTKLLRGRRRLETASTRAIDSLAFLGEARRRIRSTGEGQHILNYCGVRTDLIDYLVDRNPYKHGKFTPGTQIPIFPTERIEETRPDAILILPWNLAREISAQLSYTASWGAKLVLPIPTARVLEPGATP